MPRTDLVPQPREVTVGLRGRVKATTPGVTGLLRIGMRIDILDRNKRPRRLNCGVLMCVDTKQNSGRRRDATLDAAAARGRELLRLVMLARLAPSRCAMCVAGRTGHRTPPLWTIERPNRDPRARAFTAALSLARARSRPLTRSPTLARSRISRSRLSLALARYLGPTRFGPRPGKMLWAGIMLDLPLGLNDGSKLGVRYFGPVPRKASRAAHCAARVVCWFFVRRASAASFACLFAPAPWVAFVSTASRAQSPRGRRPPRFGGLAA